MANDRAAIVTGAAHGIGRAVARHLVRLGWQVVLADIDGEAVSAAAAEIGGAAVACDVGSEADVERLVAVARARTGPHRRDRVERRHRRVRADAANRRSRAGTGCWPPT